jgi:hypothetical protein
MQQFSLQLGKRRHKYGQLLRGENISEILDNRQQKTRLNLRKDMQTFF